MSDRVDTLRQEIEEKQASLAVLEPKARTINDEVKFLKVQIRDAQAEIAVLTKEPEEKPEVEQEVVRPRSNRPRVPNPYFTEGIGDY